MKAKSTNKLVSLALALFMLLMSIPFSMLATTARAEEAAPDKYVFDVGELATTKGGVSGDYAEKNSSTQAGTNKYFTVYYGDKGKVEDKVQAFPDEYSSTKRLDFGGTTDYSKGTRFIEFKTAGAATVKVWWASGGDNRTVELYNASKSTSVKKFGDGIKKNEVAVSTFEITEAGTYYLGCPDNTCYFFKIEVTPVAEAKEYSFDAGELATTKGGVSGDYAEKNSSTQAGTNKYFTVYYGDKGKVEDKVQAFPDEYSSTKRLDFGGTTDYSKGTRFIEFKTAGAATVKVWWASGGDNRTVELYNASKSTSVKKFGDGIKKNEVAISTFEITEAGTYYLGCPDNTCYFFKITVTEGAATKVERAPWKDVAAPEITSAVQDKDTVSVTANAVIGAKGGDKLVITMYDKDGKEIETQYSIAEKDTQTLKFTPKSSGKYTFKAVLSRDGEETTKASAKAVEAEFTLPLGTPTISSATSKGKGSDGKGTVEVVWTSVDEATGYEVYCGTEKVYTAKANETSYMVTGLEIDKAYSFTVKAVRGTEVGEASKAMEVKTTEAAQMTWGTVFYGTSTDKDHNTVTGDLNADGKVTVASTGGKGKFQEGSNDGLIFYYTAIPSNKNFTLKAKMHIDEWTLSSGQEGAGIMAIDCLPGTYGGKANSSDLFWTNSYRVGAQRFAYWYDAEKGVNSDKIGDKYQMNIGVGVQAKLGMTKDNIKNVYTSASGIVEFIEAPLETLPVDNKKGAGTYVTIGNCTNPGTFKNPAVAELTDIVIELQRNNTGYFLTYYDKDGKTILGQQKYYEPKALDQLDPDNVYVGFTAARNMKATFSDVEITTIDPKDDKPAEERPITKIDPTVTIGSAAIANSTEYTLLVKSNVAGKAEIIVGGKSVKTVDIDGTDDYASAVITIAAGTTKIDVKFTPDKDQKLPEYTALSSTDPVTKTINVKYNTYFANQKNLYVSPKGTKGGNGGKEYPLDIYTAVSVVAPGQTIILMEGTYNLESGVVIERGISGTKDKMIKMIVDPEAKSRPVLDFGKKSTVTTAGLLAVGDYWYFQGFDVTKAPDGVPGIMVSGSNCTFDDINSYTNGDCGLYIRSRGNSADPKSLWPTNNLILNCSAYNNADASGENADGFAAKFSIGKGNVFDGCISYNNCDDGWDLYARGVSIEAVTIRNCVAYENGHNTDNSIKGNGNGFKMGGENMPAGHKIINSIAFNNDANGITCNSCPDIQIQNCISFNNKSANVALYTGNASLTTNFVVDGVISFMADQTTADNLKPQTQKAEDLQGKYNFFYDGSAKNNEGKEIKADMFVSLEFKGIKRAENGMIDLGGFLALKQDALETAFGKEFADAMAKRFVSLDGDYKTETNEAGTSQDFTVTPDDKLPPPTGFEVTLIVVVIAISAAVAIVLFKKRKSSK